MPRFSALDIQALFPKLPRPIRQALVAGQSLRNRTTRYGAEYRRLSSLLAASQYWAPSQVRSFQREQLLKLLFEARRSTVYYAEAFASFSDADLLEISATGQLAALPLLEKATLKARTPDLFNRARRTQTKSSTSGSTGSPLVVQYDQDSTQHRFAHLHRLRAWGNVAPFARNVRLSGRLIASSGSESVPWLLNPFERMLLVSTYQLTPEHLAKIVQRIQRFRPVLIEGYPTAIEQLAAYCAHQKLALPSVRMVITTAETLNPAMRATIEAGFGAPLFDYYAASEGVPFICQCEAGRYHVCTDSGVFEFLRPDGTPASPGEMAEIVATSFCQWKTPLIRYRTGDYALLPSAGEADEPCACGRTFPFVSSILGRVEDIVITRDGRSIGMFQYRTLKFVPGLREAQVIQQSPERFVVRLVLDGTRPLADLRRDIVRIFAEVLGHDLAVELEVLPAIERGPNGKFRSVIRAFDPQARPAAQ